MRDLTDDLKDLRRRLQDAKGFLHYDTLAARKIELDHELARADIWSDPDVGRRVSTEHGQVTTDLALLDDLDRKIEDTQDLFDVVRIENDESMAGDLEQSISEIVKEFDHLELRSLFSGEHDHHDAICSVSAKDGGTDAQDWAEMLVRMYSRWAESRGFTMEIDDMTEGAEAGILSASFTIRGQYAYGMMAAERGIHRLVRISPFDSQARRQTSFAAFDVVPALDDVAEVEIDDKDVRIDVYRSSGAGGQHINKTSSAVRITHLASGIVVSCQNERSQLQNKTKAFANLAALLAQRARDERDQQLVGISGKKALIGWGSQIRSYVMAPYQLVKDLRTEWETGNVQGVLDGDLDPFMEAWLRYRRAAETQP